MTLGGVPAYLEPTTFDVTFALSNNPNSHLATRIIKAPFLYTRHAHTKSRRRRGWKQHCLLFGGRLFSCGMFRRLGAMRCHAGRTRFDPFIT